MRMIPLYFFIAVMAASSVYANGDNAQKALQEGTILFEKGEYARAAAAFRNAYQAKPNWKILYNIAQCEASARHYGLAIAAFEKYLALGEDDIGSRRRSEVEAASERSE